MDGNEVAKNNSIRRQVTRHLLYPGVVLFVDEVGFNTRIKNDGNKRGKKFFVERGTVPQQCTSTANVCWASLLFLDALRGLFMMGIVFAAETISGFNNIGVDIFIELVKGAAGEYMQENYRKVKRYPGLKTYEYKGERISSFITKYPNGIISYDIVTSMLHQLRKNFQFDRIDTNLYPGPVILLDSHDSRLQLPFLCYLNDPDTKWSAGISVPYGTILWQVGYSDKINENNKLVSYFRKSKIVHQKSVLGQSNVNLFWTDVIPPMNHII